MSQEGTLETQKDAHLASSSNLVELEKSNQLDPIRIAWLEKQVEIKAARVARLLRQGAFYYPEAVRDAAANISENVSILFNVGKDSKNKDFLQHITRMQNLCTEIQEPTKKNSDERDETIREFWNLIKTTPSALAQGLGCTIYDLANPKFGNEENPFIEILVNLAEARDEIQLEMGFQPLQKIEKEYRRGMKDDRTGTWIGKPDILNEEEESLRFKISMGGIVLSVIGGVVCGIYTNPPFGFFVGITAFVFNSAIFGTMCKDTEIWKNTVTIEEPDILEEWQKLADELSKSRKAVI